MDDYLMGTDVLGAAFSQAASAPGPFVTIHVKNVPEVVKKEGGGIGALALNLVPGTIENTVYSKMADEIGKGMKEKGVDADVKIVSTLPGGGPVRRDFLVGSVVGAGAVGIGYGIFRLVKHFIPSRSK